MIAIQTPKGAIIYANDFKLDDTPVLGLKPNYKRLREIAKEGVLAFVVDSLYSGSERKTPSEKVARVLLEEVLLTIQNRNAGMIVTTFSSHIARLKSIVEFGKKLKCGCGGDYEKTGEFNLLFKTNVGSLDKSDAYLRGETAQGMFMDFKLIQQSSRMKLPFGIAQIGRCFRNEISPRDFLFRSREFHIGEFEFFIHPEEMKCNLLEEKHLKLN